MRLSISSCPELRLSFCSWDVPASEHCFPLFPLHSPPGCSLLLHFHFCICSPCLLIASPQVPEMAARAVSSWQGHRAAMSAPRARVHSVPQAVDANPESGLPPANPGNPPTPRRPEAQALCQSPVSSGQGYTLTSLLWQRAIQLLTGCCMLACSAHS